MSKIAFFDCFSGISGNMALGALLDCGIAPEALRDELRKLSLGGYRLDITEAHKAGLRGLAVEVHPDEKQPHRHLQDIETIILSAGLADRVRDRSLRAFRTLAMAEIEGARRAGREDPLP